VKLLAMRIAGPLLVEQERHEDERGFFARTYSALEFEYAGLSAAAVECSTSFNRQAGTLRGLHLQRAPFSEAKLVRCTRGRIWDVAVDVRPGSDTFGEWVATELDMDSGRALYIPEGFAHGFVTIEESSEVFYQCSQAYNPEAAIGIRWDDPDLAIAWPAPPVTVSDRDRSLPTFNEFRATMEDVPWSLP
jgi:dTDP-4-dehydrorhamnose 3,5-epimerase